MTTQEQIKRYETGRQVVDRLSKQGIVFELDRSGRSFDVLSYAMNEADEFIPVAPALLEEATANRSAILAELRYRREALIRATNTWLAHDPEYAEEYGK